MLDIGLTLPPGNFGPLFYALDSYIEPTSGQLVSNLALQVFFLLIQENFLIVRPVMVSLELLGFIHRDLQEVGIILRLLRLVLIRV